MLPIKMPGCRASKGSLNLLLILAGASLAACANLPPPSSHMPLGRVDAPPSGLVSLCESAPEICHFDKARLLTASRPDPSRPTGSIGAGSYDMQKMPNAIRGRLAAAEVEIDDTSLKTGGTQRTTHQKHQIGRTDIELNSGADVVPGSFVGSHSDRSAETPRTRLVEIDLSDESAQHSVASPAISHAASAAWELGRQIAEVFSPEPTFDVTEETTPLAIASNSRATQVSARPFDAITPLVFDDLLFEKVDRINRLINAAISPRTDADNYGRDEEWTLPLTFALSRYGDCEDYALEKRLALIKAGVPASSLYLAVAYSKLTGRHALLVLSTDKGDYVLDNMTADIKPWQATNYTWISRQSSEDPLEWVSLRL